MMNLNETAARHGFCVDRVRESEELHGKMVEMHHEKDRRTAGLGG